MKSVAVSNKGLTLELWGAWENNGRPCLKLRREGEASVVEIQLSEARHLVDALVEGATELAAATVTPPEWTD